MYFWIYGLIAMVLTYIGLASGGSESVGEKVGFSLLSGVVFGALGWLFMPTLAWNFYGNWVLVGFLGACLIAYSAFATNFSHDRGASTIGIGLGAVAFVVICLVAPVTTWALFHAADYHKLLGTPVESQFNADVSPVSINQYRIVNDEKYALLLGNKRIEEVPGLGSRVDLDDMIIQRVNGCFSILDTADNEHDLCFNDQLVWVGPLVHAGFFKWWVNGTTPGYVMVNATDPSKVYLVTAIKSPGAAKAATAGQTARMGVSPVTRSNGYADLALRYMETGGYFGDYVERHLRLNGYASVGLTDYMFEIDDSGRPYWVVTKFDRTIGFGGENAVGVVVVDAQTGELSDYSLANTPTWVDRMQPKDIVTEQLTNWGSFVHGYWNTWFGKRDIVIPTPGMELVYGADGQAYWYTGMQSAGAHEATNGFVLVSARTKEVRRYMVAGASEEAAKASAQNAKGVREAGYSASSPILYNVSGEATYFMPLMGGDGLVKMFAFVSVLNYEVTGVGRSVQEALRDYQSALVNRGRTPQMDDLVKRQRIETLVVAVAKEGDIYYLRLEGHPEREFFAPSNVSPELKWTLVGHTIIVDVDEGELHTVPIMRFDNKNIAISSFN